MEMEENPVERESQGRQLSKMKREEVWKCINGVRGVEGAMVEEKRVWSKPQEAHPASIAY